MESALEFTKRILQTKNDWNYNELSLFLSLVMFLIDIGYLFIIYLLTFCD